MSIVLVGSTSGSCTLQEQAMAGTTVLTLPTTSGTVALTSDIPSVSTALYGIGTYITGRPRNLTNYTADSTIAGSSLYNFATFGYWDGSSLTTGVGDITGGSVLVNTGTWRCMSPAATRTDNAIAFTGLWIRIS